MRSIKILKYQLFRLEFTESLFLSCLCPISSDLSEMRGLNVTVVIIPYLPGLSIKILDLYSHLL